MLVCHPGGPGFSSAYLGDLAGLWERFTLVILNPRGTDGSDRPADPVAYHLDDYVADLDELRRHLGLEQMLLFGYSHGGLVAQAYASAYPDRVQRLVLASTTARFGPDQEAATQAAKEKRSAQPWFSDALAARDEQDAMDEVTDEQLRGFVFRQMPFYFARFGPAEAGYLELAGRVISDMHKASSLSLADVIRYSSNVGIVEFGQRLTPSQKYETFRDLGFGMLLGVPLPAEAPGTLREPK